MPSTLLLVALLLSGVGLLAGPLILSLGRGRAQAGAVVEGLALGLVPTMVILRLLPHVAESLGGLAVALFAGAFLVLRAFDRAHHRAAARLGRAFIYSALVLHSFTDGVGLAAAIATRSPSHAAVDVTLTVAFVIHRLPEGLFIATTLLPSYGWRRTLERTLGLFAATVVGGLAGGALLPLLSERLFDAVVAVGLGAMLQLVLHSHAERPTVGSTRTLTSAALLLGVVVALGVPAPDDLLARARGDELPLTRFVEPLFARTAPALLVAVGVAAAWHALVRVAAPTRPGRASALRSALLGIRFSLSSPVGPAQTLPTARGLALLGARDATTTAFVLASTALTLDGTLVSLSLLGPAITVAQVGGALLLALAGGLARRSSSSRPHGAEGAAIAERPAGRALDAFFVLVLRAIDQLGPPFLLGIIAAAGLEAAIDPLWLGDVPPLALWAGLPLVALLVGASPITLAPVAAVLLHKGVEPRAVLAVLLAGPIGGRARLAWLATTTSARLALTLASWLAALLLGAALARMPFSGPSLHEWAAQPQGAIELAATVTLATLLVLSLLRLGPALWFGQLVVDPEPDEHAHDHDHAHEH